MTILRNSMLLRYTAAMALFSIAINTACANSGQVGIAPVSTTTLKESILFAIDRDPSISQQAAQLGIGQAREYRAQPDHRFQRVAEEFSRLGAEPDAVAVRFWQDQ